MEQPTEDRKAKAGAEAGKNLLKLLQSGELSREEHKRILAVAASLGCPDGAAKATGEGTRLGKALFALATLAGAALLVAAWMMLSRMEKLIRTTGPGATGGPPAAAARPEDAGGPEHTGPGAGNR